MEAQRIILSFSEDTSVTLCLLRITIPRVLRRGGRLPCHHVRHAL